MPRRVHKAVLLRGRSLHVFGVTAFLTASLLVILFTERVATSQSRSRRKETTPRARNSNPETRTGPARPNLANERTLYVVGYAHLDTEWRWEYPQTIGEYLPKTLRNNFALFEKYPHYIFNFTGANRYRLMKEHNPADFERLRQYVAAGRWYPAGSSMEEGDVNSPNAESIIRQILYGNNWFRKEFGMASEEYMLSMARSDR
ncbi:MAG: hypothetical protein ACR2HX_05660 [Pyrinomonadaceae bacterium]